MYIFASYAHASYEVIRMNSNITNGDVPMGFSMALAQNLKAMEYFSSLPDAQKQAVINATHGISSKAEMKSYVDQLINPQKSI